MRTASEQDLKKKQKEFELELMKEQGTIAAGTTPKSPGMVRKLKRNLAKIQYLLAEQRKNVKP